MRHVLTAAAIAAAILATASCTGTEEPSPPPTPEAALSSEEATSTPDEVETTTSAPSTPTDETTQTSVADGPPQLPAEAKEQTEAGAEAFVRHYLTLVSYLGQHPKEGLLTELSSESCDSCTNYESNVTYLATNELTTDRPSLAIKDTRTIFLENSAVVFVTLDQVKYQDIDTAGNVINEYSLTPDVTLNFDTNWSNGKWSIDGIRVAED